MNKIKRIKPRKRRRESPKKDCAKEPDCVKSRPESNLAGEKPGIWAVSGLSSIR